MSDKSKIIETLEYVKDNPECDSINLDGLLIHNLCESGYLRGQDCTSSSTPRNVPFEYALLFITLEGSEYLSSLKQQNSTPKKASKIITVVILFIITAIAAPTVANIITELWKETRVATNKAEQVKVQPQVSEGSVKK